MNKRLHKILIADDAPSNIRILGDLLREEHEVLVATGGKKALEIARSELPDLILLDVLMPDLDGFAVCKQLKADRQTQEIPVIFVTGMDQEEEEAKGLELGAIDFITKPFSTPVVKMRVRNHLELKRHRDLLKQLTNIDGLTGIANRRRFDEMLVHDWNRSLRAKSSLGLLLIDVDYFKQYNDVYGHLQGDECLKTIASCLAKELKRSTDLLARYGGEEFVCLLPELGPKDLERIGEALCKKVEGLALVHEASSIAKVVTISLGGASFVPSIHQKPASLLAAADQNLYRAKEKGRNRLVL